MKNEIKKIRDDAALYFDANNRLERDEIKDFSESGKYYFSMTHYLQTDENRNWITSKVEIFKTGKTISDFSFLANSEDMIFHSCWVTKNNIEYLLLPEAMGGQSIYDTKNNAFFSFYSEEEPFIWLDLYPSPDANKIAVEGCYWACPCELRVYDMSDITQLPYPLIYQDWDADSQNFHQWETNNSFTLSGKTKGLLTIEL